MIRRWTADTLPVVTRRKDAPSTDATSCVHGYLNFGIGSR